MAILSRTHGFLFIESPRTGCTALGRGVLQPHLGGVPTPPENLRDENGKVVLGAKHATVPELVEHGVFTESEMGELFKFTTVRNPFDSLYSDYAKRAAELHKQKDDPNSWIFRNKNTLADMEYARDHSFAEWVVHRLTRDDGAGGRTPVQPRHITGAQLEGVDHVMRYERLQEDFDAVCERLGIEERHEIPAIHVTKSRVGHDYRDHYDDDARRVAEAVYAPDLERFGYEF